MRITPLDVGNHRFPRRWKGYDPGEVDLFLEMVGQEMEELIQENRYLSEELKRKNVDLAELKEKEHILKDTMITAQRVAEDMKNNMVKEAQAVVAQAELEADSIVRRAQERVIQLQEQIQDLREQKVRFREEVRSLLRTHLGMLDACEVRDEEEKQESVEAKLCVMPARKLKTRAE